MSNTFKGGVWPNNPLPREPLASAPHSGAGRLAQAHADRGNLYLALIAFITVSVTSIWLRPLLPVDETRYLSVAWDMWRTGDLIVPHLNGEIYTHKPPLLFWLIQAVWAITGPNEIAARLIGPATGVGCIVLTWRLAALMWPDDRAVAGRAALILATTAFFMVLASMVMFDAMLTMGTLIAVIGVVGAYRTGTLRHWALFGAGTALGVFAKGPVILLHVVPLALAMPLWASRDTRPSLANWYRGFLFGVLAALALVSLWLVPALLFGGPAYREAVLWTQSAGRMVDSFAHARPFWFYFAALLPMLWPWAWFPAFWPRVRAALGNDPMARLCAVWALSTLIVFSLLSAKQPHYLLPALAAVAILLARGWPQGRKPPTFWVRSAIVPAIVLIVAAAVAPYLALGPSKLRDALHDMSVPLIAWPVLIGLIGLIWWRAGNWRTLGLASVLMVLTIQIVTTQWLHRDFSGTGLATALKENEQSGIAIATRKYHGQFNFVGRLEHPVAELTDKTELKAWIAAHPNGVIIAAMSRRARPDWPPERTIDYRASTYGVWRVPSAGNLSSPDPSSPSRPQTGPDRQ